MSHSLDARRCLKGADSEFGRCGSDCHRGQLASRLLVLLFVSCLGFPTGRCVIGSRKRVFVLLSFQEVDQLTINFAQILPQSLYPKVTDLLTPPFRTSKASHSCARDSPSSEDEQLMTLLFDVLLVDENNGLSKSYASRRQRPQTIILTLRGRVENGTRIEINVKQPDTVDRLRNSVRCSCGHTYKHPGMLLVPASIPFQSGCIPIATSNKYLLLRAFL